jgi:hypothetical protein
MSKLTLADARKYLKENAPQIITAAAAVSAVVILYKTRQDSLSWMSDIRTQAADTRYVIGKLNSIDHPFTYYPGIGVYSKTPFPESV